jgi:hypothetical protein
LVVSIAIDALLRKVFAADSIVFAIAESAEVLITNFNSDGPFLKVSSSVEELT